MVNEGKNNQTIPAFIRDPLPVLKLPRTRRDILLEALAVIGVLALIGNVVVNWELLPAKVPTHFGVSGTPDSWGGKASLFLLPGVGLAIYAGLTGLSFFPHIYNYPWALNERNVERHYRLARLLLLCIKVELVWLFAYLNWQTVEVALGTSGGLGIWMLPATIAAVFGTVGLYYWRGSRID